jgi:hypothetical protein
MNASLSKALSCLAICALVAGCATPKSYCELPATASAVT